MPTLFITLRPALLALLMLAVVPAAMAQWKWRDATGKVQYSDLPPPQGTLEKDILQRPPNARPVVVVRPVGAGAAPAEAAPAASAPRAPTRAETEQEARKKAADADSAKRQKEEDRKQAEMRAENCRRATAQLKLLEDGVRLTRRNDAGENIPLDDRMRAEEVRSARSVIAAECKQ